MYFAADDGSNKNHRMYVVENPSPDPMEGTWEFKGKVLTLQINGLLTDQSLNI